MYNYIPSYTDCATPIHLILNTHRRFNNNEEAIEFFKNKYGDKLEAIYLEEEDTYELIWEHLSGHECLDV